MHTYMYVDFSLYVAGCLSLFRLERGTPVVALTSGHTATLSALCRSDLPALHVALTPKQKPFNECVNFYHVARLAGKVPTWSRCVRAGGETRSCTRHSAVNAILLLL